MLKFTKNQVVSNFSWRYIGKLGTQIVSFLVTIILARLIAPEAFGAVAIVAIFTTFLQVFVDSGLGSALVQKDDADDTDFSSVFYFNVVICMILYVMLYIWAPYVAFFYENPKLTSLLRVASLSLVITGLRSTQESYITRNLLFKKHFFATTVAALLSALAAIVMAYMGFEAWAIVGQQLLNTGISTIIIWFIIPWRPRLLFSFNRFSILISYGWKILGANLIDTVYSQIRSLLIGKVYSSRDLAFYEQGKTYPYMIVSGLNVALNSVLFPVMSRNQNNLSAIKEILRRTIRISIYFIGSILSYIVCSAESFVSILLTEKWLPCVIYLQILCFDSLFWPIITAHFNTYNAIGRSDISMWIMIITKLVGIAMLIIAIPFGVVWVAISSVFAVVTQTCLVAVMSKKVNTYLFIEQLSDFLKALTPAFLIFLSTWWITDLSLPTIGVFTLQSLLATIVFIVYGHFSKNEGFLLMLDLLRNISIKMKK